MSNEVVCVEDLLLEIETHILLYFSDGYIIKHALNNNDSLCGLVARDFTISFSEDNNIFYISFPVGTVCRIASDITRVIGTIINYEYTFTLDDYCWDDVNNVMVFGDEAIHTKYKQHLRKNGKVTCPICDRVLDKQYLEKSGFCPICEKQKDSLIWN